MIVPILPMSSRRSFLARTGLVGLATLPWPAMASESSDDLIHDGSLLFTAYRNGSRLGFHRLDFSGTEERLVVDIEITFDVKLAFIPVYRYRHRNREVWEEGKLVSLSSDTDDNGDAFKVEAIREGERLIVNGAGGRLDLPGDLPSTSYWNEATIPRGEWIDTQRGELARSDVTTKPPEQVKVAGEIVEANRYDLAGDITCSLWYANGRWVRLLFAGEDGSEIEYTVDAPPQNG